jgi:hypothetical protein
MQPCFTGALGNAHQRPPSYAPACTEARR